MKRIFGQICVLALLIVLIVPGVSAAGQDAEIIAENYEVAAENSYLVLYVNRETAEIAVEDKDTGKIWFSNPPDLNQREQIARGSARDRLRSQVRLEYFTPQDRRRFMDSFNDSVVHEQFTVEPKENGVRVEFTFGELWDDEDYVPTIIESERFHERILDRLDERDRQFVLGNYVPMELEEVGPDYERVSVPGVNKEKIFENYTVVSPTEDNKSTLVRLLAGQYFRNRDDMEKRDDLRLQYIEHMKDTQVYVLRDDLAAWDIDDMIELNKEFGYTPEDVVQDHVFNNIKPPQQNIVNFFVPIEYSLDGPDLIVEVPVGEVEYPRNVLDQYGRSVTFPLYSIRILDYFGAGNTEDDGYIFVPDGSGALINFNNKKLYAEIYSSPVYGRDHAVAARETLDGFYEQIHLPVYGLRKNDHAFLAVIEEGDTFARINADISGRDNSYNTVASQFIFLPRARVPLEGPTPSGVIPTGSIKSYQQEMNVYQARPIESDIRIRFSFLEGEKADYTGMAGHYQRYLVDNSLMKEQSFGENMPLFLELVGAIHETRPVLGYPRDVPLPLTTFAHVQEIMEEVTGKFGIDRVNLIYSGWLDRGLHHRLPDRLRLESVLGSREEFVDLIAYFREREGVELFPAVDFMITRHSDLMSGFRPRRDASRFLNRRVARIYDYDLANFEQDDYGYLISPNEFLSTSSAFFKEYSEYELQGVALESVGHYLFSDFRENEKLLVDRSDALGIVDAKMGQFSSSMSMLVRGANAYTFPHVEQIVSVPLQSSKYNLLDRSIPFLQSVLRGHIHYAGEPLNLQPDTRKYLLKSLESGSAPYFQLFYEDASHVTNTDFEELFAMNYFDWSEEVASLFAEISGVLNQVRGERITDHRRLASDVYQTTFESGRSVIVNYRRTSVAINGETVEPRDFILLDD